MRHPGYCQPTSASSLLRPARFLCRAEDRTPRLPPVRYAPSPAVRRLLSTSRRSTPSLKPASPPAPLVRRIPSVVSYRPSPPAASCLTGHLQIVKHTSHFVILSCQLSTRQDGGETNYLNVDAGRE